MIKITPDQAEDLGYSISGQFGKILVSRRDSSVLSFDTEAEALAHIGRDILDRVDEHRQFIAEVEDVVGPLAGKTPPDLTIDDLKAAGVRASAAVEIEQSGWGYNVQTAQITDANGLKVANDVLPEDAPLIMLAPALRKAAIGVATQLRPVSFTEAGIEAWEELEDVLDRITSHEQQSVPRAKGGRLPAVETPAMALALFEALEYERAAFDDDEEVDGGDLVEWFSGWRERAQTALAGATDPSPASMALGLMQAAAWFDEYADGHDAKGAADKAARNRARAQACRRAVLDPEEIRIGVIVEGGLFTGAFSDRLMPEVEVTVIDFDTDSTDPDDIKEMRQRGDAGDVWTACTVSRVAVAHVPEFDWTDDFRPVEADEED